MLQWLDKGHNTCPMCRGAVSRRDRAAIRDLEAQRREDQDLDDHYFRVPAVQDARDPIDDWTIGVARVAEFIGVDNRTAKYIVGFFMVFGYLVLLTCWWWLLF